MSCKGLYFTGSFSRGNFSGKKPLIEFTLKNPSEYWDLIAIREVEEETLKMKLILRSCKMH